MVKILCNLKDYFYFIYGQKMGLIFPGCLPFHFLHGHALIVNDHHPLFPTADHDVFFLGHQVTILLQQALTR